MKWDKPAERQGESESLFSCQGLAAGTANWEEPLFPEQTTAERLLTCQPTDHHPSLQSSASTDTFTGIMGKSDRVKLSTGCEETFPPQQCHSPVLSAETR